jgi:hypothetical protein
MMARQLRFAVVAIGMSSALAGAYPIASSVLAADPSIRLAVEPVGEPGAFFHRSLQPGESAELIVDLANYGPTMTRARTFAADVYPIINGGFGARLRGEPTSGTTLWLDYPTEVFDIEPGQAIRRMFSVAVPADVQPGEYITSIVIENEDPLESGEGVAFNQFVRAAIAVFIVVPGNADAAFEIGDARHSFLDGRSVVGVAIDNVGDLLLRPAGSFSVTTEAGEEVEARSVAMDSVYAHSATWIEVVLDRALAPGRYFANVELGDPGQGAMAAGARPFVVGNETGAAAGTPEARPTDTIDLPILGPVDNGVSAALAFGGGILVCAIAVGVLMLARRRRHDPGSTG